MINPLQAIDKGDAMNTKQLIDEAVLLPVEERALVVDSLLRSLNQPESEVDKHWTQEAQKRLTELRTGCVKAIPGDDVFAQVWKRFEK
jgi:putative addiction module component (TIGR02574 family)